MQVRIYKPARNAMQSGKGKTKEWVLQIDGAVRRQADPLMGWTGIDDMSGQVRLHFETRDQAIAYAEREGLNFRVEEARERKRLIKSYSENFSAARKQPWTH